MSASQSTRVELYRLLADEGRLRVLALTAEEALTVGELAELLGDSQPQISRKASALRQAGLLMGRKEGTRTWLHAAPAELDDAVVRDALAEGRRLCATEGSLQRVPEVVAAREEASHRFFGEAADDDDKEVGAPGQTSAHLRALAPLLPSRARLRSTAITRSKSGAAGGRGGLFAR